MSNDWLERTYQGKIDRAEQWIKILTQDVTGSDGKTQKQYLIWKMTREELDKLAGLYENFKAKLDLAKNKATRTEVVSRELEDAADALESYMRELRILHFHVPNLTNAEMVLLGFKVQDPVRTPLGNPTATMAVRTVPSGGYGELDVYIEKVSGDLNARENQGPVYLVWLVLPAGSPAPTHPKELTTDHLTTKRRKEHFRFGYGSSGSEVYFCARFEDGDRRGEWGPIVHARIP